MAQTSNSPTSPTREALEWLRNRVATFAGVEEAMVTTDPAGRAVLSVRLASAEPTAHRVPPVPDGVTSLLDANIAPMLVFDAETLDVLAINRAACGLLGLEQEDVEHRSFADMFAEHEVDRLGRTLSQESDEWADQGQWTMHTKAGAGLLVHHWFGPTGRASQRLVIASAAS